MDFLTRMTKVIDYIEEHISEDFNFDELANIVCCSVYQFGRIFSYITGISLSEYIRNRRLSLAALELQNGNVKVIDVAMKYGYSSSESFARAFREMHGISPKEACIKGTTLKMFHRIEFQILIKGATNMDYRIEKKDIIKCAGVVTNLGKFKANGQVENRKTGQECWTDFLDNGPDMIIARKYKLYRPPFWQIGFSQTLDNGDIILSIGAEDGGGNYPELTHFEVPAATWVVFSSTGVFGPKAIGALQTKIFKEWLPSSGYEQVMNYQMEIYPPGNSKSKNYTFEIWIPVEKTK